jgi:hypothetical protein
MNAARATVGRLIAAARRAVVAWRWYEHEPSDEATEALARTMDDLARAVSETPDPIDEQPDEAPE